jgi:hypothetical protein
MFNNLNNKIIIDKSFHIKKVWVELEIIKNEVFLCNNQNYVRNKYYLYQI